ncbi:putative ABC transport system ATP-binding protein [Cyclonatronum proteinivorum]|uniref:Putative ABC transport system ATP-binding protein n=1 Tax=Cyclonatronum proteinivorum TaxID=1457365 RepID=A0A345UG30_9BACT|nr:ABC transporter ATP-binding protein [Cyclonatronum proteinivorum]AXI99431.1 putative ABC transport system ATP-binding protein [Cyclonatronum proteinivorum]
MIDLRKITKTYRTGSLAVDALRGISLQVEAGAFTTIMGSSGSGKSTLMNILGCLDKPGSGQYFLKGDDVSGFDKTRLSQVRNETIGFVFQNFHLLPRTSALENVELPLLYSRAKLSWKEMHKRAKEALEIVGLADRADHTPNELSGGQQQRVAIARALVTRPAVLLADEPTGNLDSRTSLEIMEIFQRLNKQGLTILMVSHEPDIARFSRRIIILRDGLIRSDKPNAPRDAVQVLANWKDETELIEQDGVT